MHNRGQKFAMARRLSCGCTSERHIAVDSSDAFAVFGDDQEELPVGSQVLRIASPVFIAIFTLGMTEASTKRVRIGLKSKDNFHFFYTPQKAAVVTLW